MIDCKSSKKKILVLTPIYIGEGIPKTFTPVVHYFAREWIKNGHDVRVIHNSAFYPRFFYFIAFFFSGIIASVTGTNVPTRRLSRFKYYVIDKVAVYRMPMFKIAPHLKFSQKRINKQTENIFNIINREGFEPDLIIGHWSNPQLELIYKLKNRIASCKTCLVMHDNGNTISRLYKKNYRKLIDSIDVWGYRSAPIKRSFEANFGKRNSSFMCFSGIPKNFTEHSNNKTFGDELKKFIFVGTLIRRKFPTKLIEAIDAVYEKKDFYINYVGEGNELKKMKALICKKELSHCVKLNGYLPRNKVQQLMIDSECFVMISKGEAYGLVYLEAMAAGCIVIASRNEGFDGVINHGENGFLCESGNEIELACIIRLINNLSSEEKKVISRNAFNTAKKLSDKNVAEDYLEFLSNEIK
ncbi:glycosyltransferase family 4 protein [Labilibaculum euxinus]|uniref:Glycosyltransferase n=1 Tax=Labilibaculum euxinus TaxID=2686357 RepID=A0A7M4DAG2_9BACT|nr:glycosyltransferase [Labilibaculum euxinus]MUP39641.1 glycosyltransferase [Labilibaculum euxinus]MVB08846.1 glycosyltransferase [Labilibaculum euxinus]